jgi:hypothetical protein
VIRRAFWLGIGAAAGILGYRRVAALGRRVSGNVTGRSALHAVRETARFSRDVRDGMDIYMARHNAAAASNLAAIQDHQTRDHDQKDGR